MRLVLLTCRQIWQRTLAARLAKEHEVALVAVDGNIASAQRIRRVLRSAKDSKVLLRILLDKARVRRLDAQTASVYQSYFSRLGAPRFEDSAQRVLYTRGVNSPTVARKIEELRPDAIAVSGTGLIRVPTIHCRSRFGMINLHTGLSPYYRGGPCTFWTLYNEEPEYAGVTIHFLTEGIDSGDIVLSGRPELDMADGVNSLDCRVIDLGHRLILEGLSLLEQGRAPRVPQWQKGKLYLYRQFTPSCRLDLERRLQKGLMERCLQRLREDPPIVRTIKAQ